MRPIDADALVMDLCQRNNKPYPSSFNHDFIVKGILSDFLVCIAEAPTLDYAPVVHGEWIDNVDENGFLRNAWRKCSVCGGLNYSKKPSYCPNCGAKMDGGKSDVRITD